MSDKPIPKSLHTVTAIVNVAKMGSGEDWTLYPEAAVDQAMSILCLYGRFDPYKLRDAALRQLRAGAA